MDFVYDIDTSKLDESLSKIVIDLREDNDRDEFVSVAKSVPYSKAKLFLHKILSRWIPLFDLDAFLGMYPLFILGKESWSRIIPLDKRGGSLLDIGAGQGYVTECAVDLFSHIETTETSRGVATSLKSKGFSVTLCDVASCPDAFPKESFDVVSILNVIDRASKPVSLMKNARDFLKPDGIMVIATPIPVIQRVWTTIAHDPEESLGLVPSDSFEDSLRDLIYTCFAPLGLTPVSISRAPYICKSDSPGGVDFYDDAVIVLEKV